jgi:competence protein ComEC
MTGLYLGSRVQDHRSWIYIVVCISTAVILWAVKEKKTVFVSPLILFAAMGYLSIQPWVAPEFSPHHIINHVDSYPVKIAGVIDTHPWKNANRKKFLLQTETLRVNNRSLHVTGKIRVTVSGKGPDLFKGDRISFSSKIRSVRNFNNPGGFDYKRYMAFKKVWGTSYVSGDRVFIEERDSNEGIQLIITSARSKIAHLIDTTGEGKQQDVLKALVLGDKNSISPDLRDAFNRAGVGHLLAISGLHIGIVATAAFVLLRFIFSRVNLFLLKAWTKKGAVILSVIPVCIYGIISGMLPSTQRAVIMVIVFLMALLFEREQDTMNTLAVAAMVILVVNRLP